MRRDDGIIHYKEVQMRAQEFFYKYEAFTNSQTPSYLELR